MGADNTTLELMRVADSLGGPSRKLRGTLVAAAPVALAVRPFHGTTRTVGRMLVHLAMLSTASGWMLPPNDEVDAFSSHATMITGGVGGAPDRRRLVGSSCDDSWSAPPPRCLSFPCPSLPRLLRNAAAAAILVTIVY